MGAWGFGPFENDSALDWVSYFISNKELAKLVKRKDPDPNDLRAAAEIVLALHKLNDLWFDQEVIDGLVKALEKVIDDEEWFDSWVSRREAMKIKRKIRNYIRELKKLEGYG